MQHYLHKFLVNVANSDLESIGDIKIDAEAKESINATITNTAASADNSSAAAIVLASNLLNSSVLVSFVSTSGVSTPIVLSAGGNIEIGATDEAEIKADIKMSATGGAIAVGGAVVRNDVRSDVQAHIDNSSVGRDDVNLKTGDVYILAKTSQTIEATVEGEAKALGQASDAKSSSSPLAVNAVIATNSVLSQASAVVSNSRIEIDGSLSLKADNTSVITAQNSASLESEGLAVGVILAFNTIGWVPQNLFSNTVDALLGADVLGKQQPASVSALLIASTVMVGGDVFIAAGGTDELVQDDGAPVGGVIKATIDESVQGKGKVAAGFILATNKISNSRLAWVGPSLPATTNASPTAGLLSITVGGDLKLSATDAGNIESDVTLTSTADGGAAVGGVVATNDLRTNISAGLDHDDIRAGDISIMATGAGAITANLTGETESSASGSKEDGGGASSIAINGLIANNVILGAISAILTNSSVRPTEV